jgi:mono/diheme cytochrome c family protein
MSSDYEHQVEEARPHPEERFRSFGASQSSVEENGGADEDLPEPETRPIPLWLVWLIGLGLFWSGAYLFSFSGGFKADVFDYRPTFGGQGGGPRLPPDPKVVGKALFSANCITCHQANGEGVPGQYPPLAGSEVETGDATNQFIAIVLKGLQGPVEIKGKPFNNSMQAWEGQYTDQQLASILTYVRSDWGNNAPAITADMVKQMRAEFKDRKEQWTWPEIQKIPPKNLTAGTGGQPPGQQKPGAPAPAGQPPTPQGQAPGQPPATAQPQSQPPAPAQSQPSAPTQSQPPGPASTPGNAPK